MTANSAPRTRRGATKLLECARSAPSTSAKAFIAAAPRRPRSQALPATTTTTSPRASSGDLRPARRTHRRRRADRWRGPAAAHLNLAPGTNPDEQSHAIRRWRTSGRRRSTCTRPWDSTCKSWRRISLYLRGITYTEDMFYTQRRSRPRCWKNRAERYRAFFDITFRAHSDGNQQRHHLGLSWTTTPGCPSSSRGDRISSCSMRTSNPSPRALSGGGRLRNRDGRARTRRLLLPTTSNPQDAEEHPAERNNRSAGRRVDGEDALGQLTPAEKALERPSPL